VTGGAVTGGAVSYAAVVIDPAVAALGRALHYRVPPDLSARVRVGTPVLVPLGPRVVPGYVVAFAAEAPVAGIKDIMAVREADAAVPAPLVDLADWVARYYGCSLDEALHAMLPGGGAGVRPRRELLAARVGASLGVPPGARGDAAAEAAPARRGPRQAAVLQALEALGAFAAPGAPGAPDGPAPAETWAGLGEVAARAGMAPAAARGVLARLAELGEVRLVQREVGRDPLAGRAAVATEAGPPLTPEQETAVAAVTAACAGGGGAFLLHGVTASGKTEVYMRAAATVLAQGRSAIMLVPEIALTPQTIDVFWRRFGPRLAILHSALSAGERHDQWRRARSGDATLVIGARSAAFAPVPRLGLIVVDEEHESTYKQEDAPRYHARDVALRRAAAEGAVAILGSATPSVESFHAAAAGRLTLLRLTTRIDERPLPAVTVVDMREELKAGNRSMFSRALAAAAAKRLAQNEQIILFLNRRGHSTFVLCRECGHVMRCPHCDVSLVLHAPGSLLRCHYCGFSRPAPTVCPSCKGTKIRFFGVGTQRVEEEFCRLHPGARVVRMDVDTTRRKGSHEALWRAFRDGAAQVLVGTQMVAKGLDLPSVTLVGVISADTALNLPDFRAGERTFQLLTQVAGRAGRGPLGGEVVVQTYDPGHYSIRAAQRQDYDAFYSQEIEARRELSFPPFRRLVLVQFSGGDAAATARFAGRFVDQVRRALPAGGEVLGPAPAPLARIKGRHRWQAMLRGEDVWGLTAAARGVLEAARPPAGVRAALDVDPVTML